MTAEKYLKSIGIKMKAVTMIAFVDGALRQPDLCKIMEDYANIEKVKALEDFVNYKKNKK